MLSSPAPFSFPMAQFILFVFTVSTIYHLQRRLLRSHPTWEVPTTTPQTGLVTESPTRSALEGMFTINAIGRLGNQMGQYATLYALAKANRRPAFIPEQMHHTLAPIFKITLPVLHESTAAKVPWRSYHLNDWMED
ncbi:galactoside 2-alpha-L-fucosyltransferase 2-like, partial [Tupaia chinensis]|uniref:galactoside 2-alpha-L-fucosyltransferase 2-like n=1 Tax=Tupaia chinensis TaxID=246437 RepID=UPI000704090F